VTALFDHWLDSTETTRWCILADTTSLGGGRAYARKEFWSSEASQQTDRPQVEIFYKSENRRRYQILDGGLLK